MNKSEILIYQEADGKIKIDVQLQDETVWLTQANMAQLFGKGRSTITEHIQNIFREGELEESVVCRNFRHTTQHSAIQNSATKWPRRNQLWNMTNSGKRKNSCSMKKVSGNWNRIFNN